MAGGRITTQAILLAALLLIPSTNWAANPRKLKHEVAPTMPELARRMGLQGTVRLEIEITADGKVKSERPLGGHPLLIQCAEDAVRRWRYEPGAPSKQIVEFKFQSADQEAKR